MTCLQGKFSVQIFPRLDIDVKKYKGAKSMIASLLTGTVDNGIDVLNRSTFIEGVKSDHYSNVSAKATTYAGSLGVNY